MIGNGYINCDLQKAFVPGIPGCHEHQFKVWRALQDAKASQRSLCAVWLDLKNAYGSVHHQLIQYAMSRYHVSEKCQRVVACLYSNLTVQVRTPDWQTGMIPFQKGVFQGDPLSVSIFNMVINMYVDQISSPRHLSLAYEYSYSNSHLLLTQFADDTSIITNSVKSCQFLCNMSL